MYPILAASHAKPTRARPEDIQDHCGYCALEDGYALIVCDGVSASPQAREAAQLACASVIDYFQALASPSPLPGRERLLDALAKAQQQLVEAFPQGEALTTATAALVLPDEQQLVVATVGNSPAFYVRGDTLTRCTPADVRLVARLQNRKTVIHHGMPVLDQALSAALGAHQPLKPLMPWVMRWCCYRWHRYGHG